MMTRTKAQTETHAHPQEQTRQAHEHNHTTHNHTTHTKEHLAGRNGRVVFLVIFVLVIFVTVRQAKGM